MSLMPFEPRLLPDKSKNCKGGEFTNAYASFMAESIGIWLNYRVKNVRFATEVMEIKFEFVILRWVRAGGMQFKVSILTRFNSNDCICAGKSKSSF